MIGALPGLAIMKCAFCDRTTPCEWHGVPMCATHNRMREQAQRRLRIGRGDLFLKWALRSEDERRDKEIVLARESADYVGWVAGSARSDDMKEPRGWMTTQGDVGPPPPFAQETVVVANYKMTDTIPAKDFEATRLGLADRRSTREEPQ